VLKDLANLLDVIRVRYTLSEGTSPTKFTDISEMSVQTSPRRGRISP
jgi:hypothetical protein